MSNTLNFFKNYIQLNSNGPVRIQQAEILDKLLTEEFNFDYIECIETGCASGGYDNFGVYLSKYCKDNGGKFSTVDISEDYINKSKVFYLDVIGNNNNEYFVSDSIAFLKSYEGRPNLVHLDSLDLDMKNPVPAMLHGWLEFDAIRDKMPSGSICLVDDNYLKGSWVSWNWIDPEGNLLSQEEINVDYDIVGKGSLIYHWAQREETDWDLIGDHYQPGKNIKVILKKR